MSLEKIRDYLKEYSYLRSLQSLLHWDMETMMPSGAIQDRAERLSYVQGKLHSHITAPKYEKLLKDLEAQKLKPLEKKLLRELRWDRDLNHALPLKHVVALSEASTHANHVWAQAKKNNDWELFRPHLQKLIDMKRAETKFFDVKNPYDALIRLHDKEFDSVRIKKIFSELKLGLIDLKARVERQKTFVRAREIPGPFDVPTQVKLCQMIAVAFGLPEEHSRLDVSTHPFSINISPQDQRITTRYTIETLDALSSTMHEVGHALYELNLPREWEGTPLQEAISLSVHESQSRFWENVIGRSREFAEYLHPVLKKNFPQNMKGVSVEKLFHAFNVSQPGLIRTESSELYYNLHVIIRFEIEEMIFNHGLNAEDIPLIWNEKYKEYLGVAPSSPAEGVLQDSHWASAAFGYFPTYTLGNLISGSLYQRMKKEVPKFKDHIRRGEFAPIREYLVSHIHSKGRSITSKDIVGELDVKDYLNYLTEKFEGR